MFGPNEFAPVSTIQTEFNFLHRRHTFYLDEIKVIKTLDKSGSGLVRDLNQYGCDKISFPSPIGSWLDETWNSVKWLTGEPEHMKHILFSATSTRAGRLELLNVNKWLVEHVIKPGLTKTTEYELASYKDYREHFGFGCITKFEDTKDNKKITDRLKAVYGTFDNIEYYAGMFAEQKDFGGVHGPFLGSTGVGFTPLGIIASRLFEFASPEHLTEEGTVNEVTLQHAYQRCSEAHKSLVPNTYARPTQPSSNW